MRLWLARILIGLVIAWNLQAALAFFIEPGVFAPSFELNNLPGFTAMRGIAVLFVMWNVPYFVAAWHPSRYKLSLKEALIMQSLGLIGETGILITLPPGHAILHNAILRFIAFDAAGLAALILAFWLARTQK